MALATSRLALPYPVPDDSVDVPRDVKALADKLDPGVVAFAQGTFTARPSFGVAGRFYWATDQQLMYYDTGTAWTQWGQMPAFVNGGSLLPANPKDGQEVYYCADTAGRTAVWHLRYNAAQAGSYPWEFLGGQPLSTYDSNPNGGTNGVGGWYAHLPQQALPFAGTYHLYLQTDCHQQGGGQVFGEVYLSADKQTSPLVPGLSGGTLGRASIEPHDATTPIMCSGYMTVVAGENTRFVVLRSGATIFLEARLMQATPVRVNG